MNQKVIIFSAPSGSGKTTLVKHCLSAVYELKFSISATTRKPRKNEKNGVDYFFLSPEIFRQKIDNKEFIEYEEVYENIFYGTLKSEVEKIWKENKVVIFDVDVAGGANLKKKFGEKALAVFISPPSIKELKIRLLQRKTEDETAVKMRVEKAEKEMTFAKYFDKIIINDDLQTAKNEIENLIKNFIKNFIKN